jgi:hypothetical protein
MIAKPLSIFRPHHGAWATATLVCGLSALSIMPASASPNEPASTIPPTSEKPAQVIFWVGDIPQSRIRYEQELIRQTLERTREEFGDYSLKLDRQLRSQERLAREITGGEGLHILNGPGWSFTPSEENAIDTRIIPIPLAKGLLGYRQCIIRRDNKEKFDEIDSEIELRKITIGLGQGWLDNSILRHNGFKVIEAPDLNKLYYMLKRRRFDCLPLGIGEAQGSLVEHDQNGELMIAEELLLFYPLPVYMQVGGKNSPLARRMEQGLTELQQDGTMDQLFHTYYQDEVKQMQSPEMRVFRLENPLLPPELQDIGTDLIQH